MINTPQQAKKIIAASKIDDSIWNLEVSSDTKPMVLALLNDELFCHRPEMELTVYVSDDHAVLDQMPQMDKVRRLALHISFGTKNPLSLLSVSEMELDSLGVFNCHAKTKVDFAGLRQMSSVRHLQVECQKKYALNIEALAHLANLEVLNINTTLEDYRFLAAPLKKLTKLAIYECAKSDLSALAEFCRLKCLWLASIKSQEEVSFVAGMRRLQCLSLNGMPKITDLPSLEQCKQLRCVRFDGMTGLRNVSSLADATSLEELIWIEPPSGVGPELVEQLARMQKFDRIYMNFSSKKKEKRLQEIIEEHSLTDIRKHPDLGQNDNCHGLGG